jgi:hypothetical protein
MLAKLRASLDAGGRIVEWDYGVWSHPHATRPVGPRRCWPRSTARRRSRPRPPKAPTSPEGQGDRNAVPLYAFPTLRVVHHFLPAMPVRVSALRALGAYHNVFALECFMDELALAAGVDPVEFRLRHLEDERARDVIRLAASKFGWKPGAKAAPAHGYGFAFARYKNLAAYCALAVEVRVDPTRGRVRLMRAVAAVDSGQVVNPTGCATRSRARSSRRRAGRCTRR